SKAFFNDLDKITFNFSKKTGKIKYIYYNNILQASYRPPLGTFSLSLASMQRIIKKLSFPLFRIIVQNDVSEFIKDGKSVFTKHVKKVDPSLHVGDEVFVVDEDDQLLAIGKICLPPSYLSHFQNGCAVRVRKGINSLKGKK
ncbi:MAG: PUA domain-containing protein, partial [Promethearchaeota archaeon]